MQDFFVGVLFIVVAYIIGSISFAVLASKCFKLADPRSYGSRNPGATNVLRTGNKSAAIFTLIGDCLKGFVAVKLTMVFLPFNTALYDWFIAGVAVAVFLGHLYPLFLNFKGGKGVATAVGVLLALHSLTGLLTIIIWLLVAILFRYSSLAALLAAACAPFLYLMGAHRFLFNMAYFSAIFILVVLLFFRHKKNIHNLLHGKESKIGKKK